MWPGYSQQTTYNQFGAQPPPPLPQRTYSTQTTNYGVGGATVTRSTTTQFENSWYSAYYQQYAQNQQALQTLQYWFNSVDRDRSGSITSVELAQVQFNGRPLGVLCASKMIMAFDRDGSGTIDFREYCALHGFLSQMSNAFLIADRDRSGSLEPNEIFTAITAAGFQLSQPTVITIVRKYNNTGYGGLTFERFLLAMAHLAIVRSIFDWNDTSKVGRVMLTYDQLAHITIQCV